MHSENNNIQGDISKVTEIVEGGGTDDLLVGDLLNNKSACNF